MNKEVCYLEKKDIKNIISHVDFSNNMDFLTFNDSFKNAVDEIEESFINELCIFLVEDLGYSCDADLLDITDEEIEDILDFIENYEL